jgi:hypothetical protein
VCLYLLYADLGRAQRAAEICRSDPDIIVGHDFSGTTLDVLLHRMRDLKVQTWAHIGRFKRDTKDGIKLRQMFNTEYLTGRMLCDLSSEGSKVLRAKAEARWRAEPGTQSMITSVTWSLTEMCLTHLKVDREEIDPEDTANYFDATVETPDHLVRFVRHCEADAYFQMALAHKVQLLPLTRQLTNLAGNSWYASIGSDVDVSSDARRTGTRPCKAVVPSATSTSSCTASTRRSTSAPTSSTASNATPPRSAQPRRLLAARATRAAKPRAARRRPRRTSTRAV